MSPLPTIADIEAARDRLLGHARRTPLLAATPLDTETGGRILFKLETLQHTGSFKFRGAYNRLAQLDAEARWNFYEQLAAIQCRRTDLPA